MKPAALTLDVINACRHERAALAVRNGLALLAAAGFALAAPAALSQETPGVAQSTSGAVIKGRAPVAKELIKVRLPKPKSFMLTNGVLVYVIEDHRVPAVRLTLVLRAGRVFESKPGVAEATATMLTEGAGARDSQQLAAAIEEIGANLSAAAGMDTTTVSASGLSESTDALVGLLADVVRRPTFPADRLDRSKFVQRSELRQRRASSASATADLSARTFYGGTPYGRMSPTAAEIASITREDLVGFHDAYFNPNGAILGVTGDVDAKALQSKLEAAFGEWKPASQTAELPSVAPTADAPTRIYLVDRPGSAQTVLQFGHLAVAQSDPDYIPLVVANRILGGGSSGRLFQNIRERKGYTYGAYSTLGATRYPAVWSASASVRTPVTEPAAREFLAEFARLRNEPVSVEELDRAKRSILGGFALTLESAQGVLGRTMELVENGLPLDYWDTYPARIEAVTADDVQRVARKYLADDRIQVFAVGERSQIEEGLRKLGMVQIVDPSELGGGAAAGGRRARQ